MSESPRTVDLGALVGRIVNRTDRTGCWSIAVEEVMTLLGVEPVRYWRVAHGLRDRIGFFEAVDGFTQDTVGDLVSILEQLVGLEAEEALTRAGIFLPHPLRVELMDELLYRARQFTAAHSIREEEFAAMLRFTGSVSAAIAIYLDEHVTLDAIFDDCAESFRLSQVMAATGRMTAGRYLHSLLSRHILDRNVLFAGLEARLRIAAGLLGYVDPADEARASQTEGSTRSGYPSRQFWALQVMGLTRAPITQETLRSRFRELMMRYHPDINPAGLERCKNITAAYSLLSSQAAEQPMR